MNSNLPFVYIFILMIGVGRIFSISSLHWLRIWVGLEINLIGFLPLLVYGKKLIESESAVKYFIVQALGSRVIIFGRLLGYNISLSWDLNILSLVNLLGSGLIICGLLIKLGVFPFHVWVPSVIRGLSWISCILLATWQKVAPLFLLIVFMELNNLRLFVLILCFFSSLSALVGGIGGVNQTQIRALLGYSSIGHIGWIIYSLLHREKILIFYFLVYFLISICVFMSLWALGLRYIKDLSIVKNYNIRYLRVILILLSLGGLPPLLGFISKFLVFTVGVESPFCSFIYLIILGSLISLYYYLSLFFSIVFNRFMNSGLLSFSKVLNLFLILVVLVNLIGGFIIIGLNFLF